MLGALGFEPATVSEFRHSRLGIEHRAHTRPSESGRRLSSRA
jgi:hypothetical protein